MTFEKLTLTDLHHTQFMIEQYIIKLDERITEVKNSSKTNQFYYGNFVIRQAEAEKIGLVIFLENIAKEQSRRVKEMLKVAYPELDTEY